MPGMFCTTSSQAPLHARKAHCIYHHLVGSSNSKMSKAEFVCRVLPLPPKHRLASSKWAFICLWRAEQIYFTKLPCSRSQIGSLALEVYQQICCCNSQTNPEPWVGLSSKVICTAGISPEMAPVPPPQSPQQLCFPEQDNTNICLSVIPCSVSTFICLVVCLLSLNSTDSIDNYQMDY